MTGVWSSCPEHGRLLPGRRGDPGLLHRLVPERQEAGPPAEGEDREAAGDGAAGSAAAAGLCLHLPLPGRGGGSGVQGPAFLRPCLLPLPHGSEQEETPDASLATCSHLDPACQCCPTARLSRCHLLLAVPTHSAADGPALSQRRHQLPLRLSAPVPSCAAEARPPAAHPAARLHHAVEDCQSSSHSTFSDSSYLERPLPPPEEQQKEGGASLAG